MIVNTNVLSVTTDLIANNVKDPSYFKEMIVFQIVMKVMLQKKENVLLVLTKDVNPAQGKILLDVLIVQQNYYIMETVFLLLALIKLIKWVINAMIVFYLVLNVLQQKIALDVLHLSN
jgi:hypothetical protein